jgi:mRNA-degrading endonuclease RelE of RelBE toxin-antitoxin system
MNSINKFIWLPRFKRDYKKLTPQFQKRINHALLQMERDLKHPSLESKKLKGTNSIWEARASKSLRITFNLKGKLIILRTVGEHKILNRP